MRRGGPGVSGGSWWGHGQPQARGQLLQSEGLDHVIVDAVVVAAQPRAHVDAVGDGDDRGLQLGAQPAAERQHFAIDDAALQQHHVRQPPQRPGPGDVGGVQHVEPQRGQTAAEGPAAPPTQSGDENSHSATVRRRAHHLLNVG